MKQHTGAAILLALLITSIVAVIVFTFSEELSLHLQQTAFVLNDEQNMLYAEGGVTWAKDLLFKQSNSKKPENTRMVRSPVSTIQNTTIQTAIEDLQSRFNINNLSQPEQIDGFIHLLKAVDREVSDEEATALALAIHHWITPVENGNQLDEYYGSQAIPYRAPHHLITSTSELRFVRGMTAQCYEKISPYLAALPEITPLNFNTALPPVFLTLHPKLTMNDVETIVQLRKANGTLSKQKLLELPALKKLSLNPDALTNSSRYFLIESDVSNPPQTLHLFTLLERKSPKEINSRWQSREVW